MLSTSEIKSWVVVDSQIWVDYFSRKKSSITDEVDRLMQQSRVCLVGPILYELLVGPKSEGHRQYLYGRLRLVRTLPSVEGVWLKAIELGRLVKVRKGTCPISDIFIAAHCQFYGYALFTKDHHFDIFSSLKRYRP